MPNCPLATLEGIFVELIIMNDNKSCLQGFALLQKKTLPCGHKYESTKVGCSVNVI